MSRASYTRLQYSDGAGAAAEAQFRSFLRLQSGTFKSVPLESEERILEVALQRHTKKIDSLMMAMGYRSYDQLLNLGSAELMDRLFKSDFLVEYEDINGNYQWLSVDVTTSPNSFKKKVAEMCAMRSSLKTLGVDRVLVVAWDRRDFQDMTRANSYSIAGDILDLLDSNSHFCNTIVLNKDNL